MAHEAGTSSAGASTIENLSGTNYDVFLNFRGRDSRSTVVDELHEKLKGAGFKVFYDEESIRQGEVISEELKNGIANSKIYIPIFSKDYASSKWCLLELELMVGYYEESKEKKKEEEKTILPVFFGVTVEDLKLKTNLYQDALKKQKETYGEEVVNRWEKNLKKAAYIRGEHVDRQGLVKVKQLIVDRVAGELGIPTDLEKELDGYVGIRDQMEDIMRLLAPDASNEVRVVTFYGMAGMGKTTLARFLFRKLIQSPHFLKAEATFLSDEDVRGKYHTADIVSWQKALLSRLVGVDTSDLTDSDRGVNWIEAKLNPKKVLIVLDALDDEKQLLKLAGETSWFGKGSRVIVTASKGNLEMPRDKGFYPYLMPKMKDDDAFKLLCRKAFNSDSPPQAEGIDVENYLRKAVETAGGNPGAICAIASSFRRNQSHEWERMSDEFQGVHDKDLKRKLLTVYEELDKNHQEIFLDIACLFISKEEDDAFYYWEDQQLRPWGGIMALKDLFWIEIADKNKLRMNRSVIELGRGIVRDQSSYRRLPSRLWSPKEALGLVRDGRGTDEVLGLNLGILDGQHEFNHNQFKRLENLRFLELNGGKFKKEDFNNAFLELRWFSWGGCQTKFRTINCCFKKLVVLMISETQIKRGWGGWDEIEEAENLKVLKCIDCPSLKKSPNFSSFRQLEKLVFKNCPILKKIDKSIGDLVKLKYLCLWCPALEKLPESVGKLSSLLELDISHTTFTTLPESVINLIRRFKVAFKYEDCGLNEEVLGNIEALLSLRQVSRL